MKASAFMPPTRLTLLAIAGAIAIITAFTVPATPASATVARTSAAATPSAIAASQPCSNSTPADTYEFFRCTTTSPTGPLVAGFCIVNQNYNVNNAPFNVYAAKNYCAARVWLHQQTNWSQGGWSYCINPPEMQDPYQQIPSQFQHPSNIYISSNDTQCP